MKETADIGKQIYYRLDTLARDRGTRISAVCDQLGLRRALVSDLKTGKTKTIGSNYLADFANYFHVTIDYLYNGDRDDLVLTSDESILLNAWRECTDDERENVAFILRNYGVKLPKKNVSSSVSKTG